MARQKEVYADEILGERVRVAYNLNQCAWDKPVTVGERCFSVRPKPAKWKVQGYTDQLYLKDVTFKVSESGHRKVLKDKVRGVFAFIEGTVAKVPAGASPHTWPELTFNPFKDETFVLRDGRVPLLGCEGAYFDGRVVRCKGAEKMARNGKGQDLDKAVKLRERFQDREHSSVRRMPWNWPKQMVEVGTCEAILYNSDKWQKDGKRIDYKHVSEGPQRLLLSLKEADGGVMHGPLVDLKAMPDSFAVLAKSLGVQTRLFANDDGTKFQKDYAQLSFSGCTLGAGILKNGDTFCFVFDDSGVVALVVGDKLEVLKDGIVG